MVVVVVVVRSLYVVVVALGDCCSSCLYVCVASQKDAGSFGMLLEIRKTGMAVCKIMSMTDKSFADSVFSKPALSTAASVSLILLVVSV